MLKTDRKSYKLFKNITKCRILDVISFPYGKKTNVENRKKPYKTVQNCRKPFQF